MPWLLVALHGYGGSGSQFGDALRDALGGDLPAPAWCAPDGPEPAPFARSGTAWHGLTRDPAALPRRRAAVLGPLGDQVAACQEASGVGPDRTAAIGFSQGGTLAGGLLEAGLCTAAAAVCAPLVWDGPVPAGPPARHLSIFGGKDRFLPLAGMAADHPLYATGFALRHVLPSLEHEARRDALRLALRFVRGSLCGTPFRSGDPERPDPNHPTREHALEEAS
jgi:predicted esterase